MSDKTIIGAENRYAAYLNALKTDFTKVTRLEFLTPSGSVGYALDNDYKNRRSGAFLQQGAISCNLQNGARRQADITLSNLDEEYNYAVGQIWFGQQIRILEGLLLPDGTEYLIPQGVFEIVTPKETVTPDAKTVTYHLTDKWANLDGTLRGNLEGAYSVAAGTNIFEAIDSVLRLDRFTMGNNGTNPLDAAKPIFTGYYNHMTQTLSDGTLWPLTTTPYTYLSADNETLADVVLGLCEMLAAWVGYNHIGRLIVDPSQDDIADATKPVLWNFTDAEKQFLGAEYTFRNTEVYNDIIVAGATSDEGRTARARVQNRDPASDTCISRIGLKTQRLEMPNYYSDEICRDYAEWKLKRTTALTKEVAITSTQMFHIVENEIVTVALNGKPGRPVERFVVQGFTRPLGQQGTMTINAVSVNDYPQITSVADVISGTAPSPDNPENPDDPKPNPGIDTDLTFSDDFSTENGVVSLVKAQTPEEGNEHPITSAAVSESIGNINALLAEI